MSTAIHVVTESSDHYNTAHMSNLNEGEIITFLKEYHDTEFKSIGEVWVSYSDGSTLGIDIERYLY